MHANKYGTGWRSVPQHLTCPPKTVPAILSRSRQIGKACMRHLRRHADVLAQLRGKPIASRKLRRQFPGIGHLEPQAQHAATHSHIVMVFKFRT